MDDGTEIDDFFRNSTNSESGHNNEVSKIDLKVKVNKKKFKVKVTRCNVAVCSLHKLDFY